MTAIKDFIAAAAQINWFSGVGREDVERSPMRIVHVRSWKEALSRAGSVATSNAWMEGRALLTRYVGLNHRLEYRKWNDIVAQAHEALGAEVFPAVDAVIERNPAIVQVEDGVPYLKHAVRWDLVAAYMEQAYSHLIAPRFYALLFDIFVAGHFPSGWDEVWPDGQIWVY